MDQSSALLFVTLLFCGTAISLVSGKVLVDAETINNSTKGAGTLRSLITVWANPESGSSIYIKLYSKDDTRSGTFTQLGSVSYSFTAGAATKFWVDAIKTHNGQQVIYDAPVFGDGVPKKSGTWWVDRTGLRRIREDNKDCPSDCRTAPHIPNTGNKISTKI